MYQVYISIGSNIEPLKHIRNGVQALHKIYGELQISPVYESAAVGFSGENFYNLVVGLTTSEDVQVINQQLAQIETDNLRQRSHEKFSSRTLDLDLLLYGNLVLQQGKLKLPREEILKYAFVLRPLADLIPEQKHPITQQTYAQLWHTFDVNEQELWQIDVSLL